ncbi:MAG: rhodanese-like domain-containing protein [Gammaproteobacteria bacterium]|nr:rhodanese-like domain-containing protein [Gammaproteobacteria bacterium]
MRTLNRLHYLGCTFWALFTFGAIANANEMKTPESIAGTTRISAPDIFDLYDKYENLIIIDSRKPSDRAGGYIEGSIALPDTDTTAETLAKHIPSKTSEVVFYCNGPKCGRSVKASKMAVKEGYKNIFWFRGGWEEWTQNEYPFVKD